MAAENKTNQVKILRQNILVWILFSVGILLITFDPSLRKKLNALLPTANTAIFSQPTVTVCKETRNSKDLLISEEKPKSRKMSVQRDCSSEIIEIPGGRCFKVKAPGWLEYQFATGEKVEVGENGNKIFSLPSSRFRLKGKPGITEIWLEPCK